MRIISLALCLFFCGCTGYQYVSPPHYVPVNLEKGDLTLDGNFNLKTPISSYQVGYSLTNHFSIFTSGYFRENKGGLFNEAIEDENSGAYIQKDKQRQFDLGITYYNVLNDQVSFELVSGAGYGLVSYSNRQNLGNDYEFGFDARKMSLYVQPNLSFRYKRILDLSFFTRLNHSQYYDMRRNLTLGERLEPKNYDQYFLNKDIAPFLFMEPGFQFRVGYKYVKFHLMYTKAFDLLNTDIQYRHNNLYLGVSLNLNLINLK